MIYTHSWLLVIVAAIVSFAVGWIWYGPLFGKLWMRLSGIQMGNPQDPNAKKMMMRSIVFGLAAQILTSFIFFTVALSTVAITFSSLAVLALWVTIGFQVPILVGDVLWQQKPWPLFLLNACYQFVNLLVIAFVFTFTM